MCLESASGYTAAILGGYNGYNKHKRNPKVRARFHCTVNRVEKHFMAKVYLILVNPISNLFACRGVLIYIVFTRTLQKLPIYSLWKSIQMVAYSLHFFHLFSKRIRSLKHTESLCYLRLGIVRKIVNLVRNSC